MLPWKLSVTLLVIVLLWMYLLQKVVSFPAAFLSTTAAPASDVPNAAFCCDARAVAVADAAVSSRNAALDMFVADVQRRCTHCKQAANGFVGHAVVVVTRSKQHSSLSRCRPRECSS